MSVMLACADLACPCRYQEFDAACDWRNDCKPEKNSSFAKRPQKIRYSQGVPGILFMPLASLLMDDPLFPPKRSVLETLRPG